MTLETTGEHYWFRFDTRRRADDFVAWINGHIQAGRSIMSLFGAFSGATGGMSSVDFVRAIRDGEAEE